MPRSMTFYEDDEDPADIEAAFAAGEPGLTAPPPAGTPGGPTR